MSLFRRRHSQIIPQQNPPASAVRLPLFANGPSRYYAGFAQAKENFVFDFCTTLVGHHLVLVHSSIPPKVAHPGARCMLQYPPFPVTPLLSDLRSTHNLTNHRTLGPTHGTRSVTASHALSSPPT